MIEPSPLATSGLPHAGTTRTGEGLRISRRTIDGLSQQSPTAQPEKVRQLRGTVRGGVEHTSQVLVGPQGEVLAQLLGGPAAILTDGQTVFITGVFVTDLHTTVQQGRPFRVDAAEIAAEIDSASGEPGSLGMTAPFRPAVD